MRGGGGGGAGGRGRSDMGNDDQWRNPYLTEWIDRATYRLRSVCTLDCRDTKIPATFGQPAGK